jgi:hypothetical protein
MAISLPVTNQVFVGNPAAAPEIAPIQFTVLDADHIASLAEYLGYISLSDMESAHRDLSDGGEAGMVGLQPAIGGVFLVGMLLDGQCQEQVCSFGLEMAGKRYKVVLDPLLMQGSALDLEGRRVRVYGVQQPADQVIDARLLDLGEAWWVWWRPAWVTVYQKHDFESEVWVYSVADHNPYSTVDMTYYPTLTRGEPILTKGKWLEGGTRDSMTFVAEDVYRLGNGVYRSLSNNISLPPMPTVTIRPTSGP